MTITQVGWIDHLLIMSDITGDYSEDYDLETFRILFVDEINVVAKQHVPSVVVTTSGAVYADADDKDDAMALNWKEITDSIDIAPLLAATEKG
jgi:hypothetical protein